MNSIVEFDARVVKLVGIVLSLRRRGLLTKPGITQSDLDEFKQLFDNCTNYEFRKVLVIFLVLNSDIPYKLSYFTSQEDEEENWSQFICISPPLSLEVTIEIISKLGLGFELYLATENCSLLEIHELFAEASKSLEDVEFLCEIFKFVTDKVRRVLLFREGTLDERQDSFYGHQLVVKHWEAILEKLINLMNKESTFENLSAAKALSKFFQTVFSLLQQFMTFRNGYDLESNPMLWFIPLIRNGLREVRKNMTDDFWDCLGAIYLEPELRITAREVIGESIYNFFHFLSKCGDEEVEALNLKFLDVFEIYPKRRLVRIMELKNFNLKTWSEALTLHLEPVKELGPGHEALASANPFKDEKFIDFGLEFIDEVDKERMYDILLRCMRVLHEDEDSLGKELELKIKKLFMKVLPKVENIRAGDFTFAFYVRYPKLERKFKLSPDSAEMNDFNEKLTKTFNQISSEKSIKMIELLTLCILSKERTLTAMCRSALSDANQLDFYADLIESLKHCFLTPDPASADRSLVEQELEKMLLGESSEKESQILSSFLEKLAARKLVAWPFFRKILSIFHCHLASEEYDKALCFLSYLKGSWDFVPVKEFNVAFIMYMAQTLEKFSWGLETFSAAKCQATELLTEIISRIHAGADDLGEEDLKCLAWALENMSCYSEITQSYFVRFWEHLDRYWCPVPSTFPTFLLHLIHSGPKNKRIMASIGERCLQDVNESLALSLAMVLPRLPTSLWDKLYGNLVTFYEYSYDVDGRLEALKLFSSFMYLLTLMLNENRDTFACYRYCVTTFGRIFQRAISEWQEGNFEEVVKSAVFFLQAIADDGLRENCSIIFLPVFTDFVNLRSQASISDSIKVLGVNKIKEVICNLEKNRSV